MYALLHDEKLTRYYALNDKPAPVAQPPATARALSWLEPLLAKAEAAGGDVCSVELDVQGIHCAACVWLMDELVRREGGHARAEVNPAVGKVDLRWRRGSFDVERWVRHVERFGYRFGPSLKTAPRTSTSLLLRLGVSVALTGNVMAFSMAFYTGLAEADGALFTVSRWASVALSAVNVAVGGWPFFKAAVEGLRQRVLHLDVPIALGIALVFVTSLWQLTHGSAHPAYFDSLNSFITLMLLGRWVQQHVVDLNHRRILEDGGVDALSVRRLQGGALSIVAARQVGAGDELLIPPGDLLPVDATLLDVSARLSTDWIDGEPEVKHRQAGATLAAGSFNAGDTAMRVRAQGAFDDSPLLRLLRPASRGLGPAPSSSRHQRFYDRLARGWSAMVLALAAAGFAAWYPVEPARAVDVAVALLVVTCPCALGLAVPLAWELVESRLRRAGFVARAADVFDRFTQVKKLVFDKTGTLTLGTLELANPAALAALDAEAKAALHDLCARSNHPVSRCLTAAVARLAPPFDPDASVREVPGQGLELLRAGRSWRLGSAAFAGAPGTSPGGAAAPATVLSVDGERVAAFELREALRPDARRELQALSDAGHSLWLLSGDREERVAEVAAALGIPLERALAAQTPEDKARTIAALDGSDTLFVGDGVNDSLAFGAALVAGTPALDRPVMPARSDFFLLGDGLAPLRQALDLALRLRATLTRVLVIAAVYNLVAVGAALAGAITPLRAAVAMPASSLFVLAYTWWRLGGHRRRPRAQAAGVSATEVPAWT